MAYELGNVEWWRFCGVVGESREWMQGPWSYSDGRVYATDGRIAIRHVGQIDRVVGPDDVRQARSVVDVFANVRGTEKFQPLGEFVLQPSIRIGGGCPGCMEVGRVGVGRRDSADSEIGGEICGECQGTCYSLNGRFVARMGNQFVHGFYARALATLPFCEWRPLDPDPTNDGFIHFRWGWAPESKVYLGEGLLSPLFYETETVA